MSGSLGAVRDENASPAHDKLSGHRLRGTDLGGSCCALGCWVISSFLSPHSRRVGLASGGLRPAQSRRARHLV